MENLPDPIQTETNESIETEDTQPACPECGGQIVRTEDDSETVCTDCGLIIEEDRLDRGPEWRAFTTDEAEERSRVGAPMTTLLHDKGLSTVIAAKDADAYGTALNRRQQRKMARLRTWNERFHARDAVDRNLKQALGEIERMGSALGLPTSVRETASVIYRRALEEDLIRGRSIEAVATGSLYAAARQAGVPRSLDEFSPVSRVDQLEFARSYRYLNRELSLAIEHADPVEYVPRIASDLSLTDETERRARTLLDIAKEAGLHVGKHPVGLAAAAIYAAGLLTAEQVTQANVSEAANVSEVTIRIRYQELLAAADATPIPES